MATGTTQSQLVATIHASVGRNLIRGQSLEIGLKTLVPLLSIGDARNCLDGLEGRRAETARNTLGQLIGSFLDSSSSDDPTFKQLIDRVLEDRNNLVHHFHSTLGQDALTTDGCERVIRRPDEQFAAIKAVESLVCEILLDVLQALRDITFANSTHNDDFVALCSEYLRALQNAGIITSEPPPKHADAG